MTEMTNVIYLRPKAQIPPEVRKSALTQICMLLAVCSRDMRHLGDLDMELRTMEQLYHMVKGRRDNATL